jgi:hypothetical protein
MKALEKAFNGKQVRVIIQKGVEWFVARDVCVVLDIKIDGHTFADFPDKEKGRYSIPTPGGEQKTLFVNEPGLYRLIFKSRKPEAEAFKTWVPGFWSGLPWRMVRGENKRVGIVYRPFAATGWFAPGKPGAKNLRRKNEN